MIYWLLPFQTGEGGNPRNRRTLLLQYSHPSYIWVNKGFPRGRYDFRNTALSRRSPRGPGGASVLRLAPASPMVGPGSHAPSVALPALGPPRAPKSSSLPPTPLIRASSHRLPIWPTSRRSPTPFFMASLLCCGPKLAACGIVLSAWGVIMLVRGLPGDNRRGEGLRGPGVGGLEG